jgi:AraC family transcriptional regulator
MKNEPGPARRAGPAMMMRDGSGLGWEHLGATAYRSLRGNESYLVPPVLDSYLVKIQTSTSPLHLEWNYGNSRKACWDHGTMAFLPIGESTQWRWERPLESLIFGVRLDFWNRVAGEVFGRDGTQTILIPKFCPEDGALRQLLLVLAEEFYAGAPNGPLYAEGLALALATRLLRHHSSRPARRAVDRGVLPAWKLQRIKEYIEGNLGDRISLADLASAAEVSSAYLPRIFRKTTGVAPYRYVLRQRILRAMDLVVNSGMDLNDIAATTGFSSQSHFTSTFRNATQMTPNEFRRTRGRSR